jgi:hypothetical protein
MGHYGKESDSSSRMKGPAKSSFPFVGLQPSGTVPACTPGVGLIGHDYNDVVGD